MEIQKQAKKTGITWPIELSDKQLMSLLYQLAQTRKSPPEPDMKEIKNMFLHRI